MTNPAGKAVEGAYVMALPAQETSRPSGGGLAPESVRWTHTGREGRATLELLRPGPWTVVVHARGFVTRRLARVVSGPLTVRLDKGGSITGLVREGRGKRPVAGARVAVRRNVPLVGSWEEEATRNETTTDAKGRFRIDGIGRTPVRVAARAPGFGEAEREARAGEDVELFLFAGATLAGTVRDDDGRPVKRATVRAEGDRPGRAPPAERTDFRGEFVVSGVRPGAYTVVAREGGRAPGIVAIVVEPEAEARVSIVASEGGFVTGRLVDPDERPLLGRLCVEVVDGKALPLSVSGAMAAATKADGTFVFGPLPLGALGIGFSAQRYASRRVDAQIARRATVDLGEVRLDTGLVIRGRVRDREGGGIDVASVRARLRRPGGRSQFEGTSESDGAYVVAGLEPGTYELTAQAPGFAPARSTATAGGDPVDLVMDQGGEIAGRVLDAAGQPAEDATLFAQWADDTESGRGGGGSGRADEGDGRFVLRDLAAGRYVLQASARGNGEASLAGVRVVAGKTSDVGTLRLRGGGVVRGTVVDVDGQGVPGATVFAEREMSLQSRDLVDQTQATGAFELRGVPPGRVSVMASHSAYAPPKPIVAEVEPDKEVAPVRIVLQQGARVEGRALHRDGRPVANARVRLTSLEAGAEGTWQEPSPVGPDGWFAIDHVGAGRTRIDLLAASSPGVLSGLSSRDVVLREGETVTVDFSLREVIVSGLVTRGSQPASGVRVSVRSMEGASLMYTNAPGGALEVAPGPPLLAATSCEDGSYELLVVAPGRALVSLESVAGNQRYPSRQVQVPDVERFELNLEIAETVVSGIVVDKGSGDPVADADLRLGRARSVTGRDGLFSVAAEPGDQQLEAQAEGRKRAVLALKVRAEGLSDVRVELERGLELRGRVVDAAGRPAPGVTIVVTNGAGEIVSYLDTLADGTFRLAGLGAEPYTFVAGGDLSGWAARGGVTPDDEPVTLTLRPGGRIAVRVRSADQRPVGGVHPEVRRLGGLPVAMPGGWPRTTDANGVAEIAAPSGRVDVEVGASGETGRGSVMVRAGETVPLDIVLAATPKAKAR